MVARACGDQRHLGLCLGYVPALTCGSCRVSNQAKTLRASDLHNARTTIFNPFNIDQNSAHMEFLYVADDITIDYRVDCNFDNGMW